jgi:hypothetical protein
MRLRPLAIACLFIAAFVAADAFGCPTCKDGIAANDTEGANLARGYFYSILLMLAMPLTLVSSFGAYVWREMRRQQRQGQPSPDSQQLMAEGVPARTTSGEPQS